MHNDYFVVCIVSPHNDPYADRRNSLTCAKETDVDGEPNLRRRLNRRSVLKGFGLAGLASTGLGLAACGSSGGTTAGKGGPRTLSGHVSFVNYEGWIGTHTIKDFEALHHGVTIQEVSDDASFRTLIPKIKRQPDLYDMALGSIDSVGKAVRLGLIAPLDFGAIPNVKHLNGKFVDIELNSGPKYFVPTDYGKVGIGIRSDLVHDDIRGWADLWRLAPKYKGKLFVYDHDVDLMSTGLLVQGFQVNDRDPNHISAAGTALKQLKPSIGTLGTSGIGAALASGDAAIAVTYDYEIYAAQQKNPKVQWIAPEEGMTGYLEGWVAFKKTKVLDVIEAFTDFHLEPKNYAGFVTRNDTAYVETGLDSYLPKKLSSSPILFPPEDVLSKVTFEEYLGEASPLYDRAYTEFKAA
jgi:spermidine/putrescine transport system substrate-binding protein